MVNFKTIGLALFFGLFLKTASAYVLSVNSSNNNIRWASSSGTVRLHFSPQNSGGISRSQASNIMSNAVNDWDQVSSLDLQWTSASDGLRNGRNDVVFSNDPNFFSGSGVAGVTVTVSQSNGSLIESDILLRDVSDRSDFQGSMDDILTHEVGHLIGLDHTQVHGATMFYELNDFQDTLHTDDVAGAQVHYPTLSNRGSIKGEVIGGPALTPVYGAHVQAISEKSGEVYASAVSQDDGSFEISGLPRNDQYYLYTSPLKATSTLPKVYGDVKSDFCESRNSYEGGFYQTCRSSEEGHPQALSLKGTRVSAGQLTIQCSVDSPEEYMLNKESVYDLDLFKSDGVGETYVGYFSPQELDASQMDEVEIDLSSYSVPGSEHYLEVSLSTEDFFSPLKLEVDAYRNSSFHARYPTSSQTDFEGIHYDSDGSPTMDLVMRLPLDEVDSMKNVFRLEISGQRLSEFLSFRSKSVEDYFPTGGIFESHSHFYLLQANIVKKSSGEYVQVDQKSFNISDNTHCPEASETYRVSSKSYGNVNAATRASGDSEGLPVACGNIGGPHNGGGPGGGPLMMTALGFLLAMSLRRKNKISE